MTETPPPEGKDSRRDRLADGLRTAGSRSREAVVRPGGLRDQAHDGFAAWFRKVWTLRGGGLYALGFAVTFFYLEITELILDDIPALFALERFSPGALIGFVVDFLIDTLKNTIAAFIWPVFVLQWKAPIGAMALLAAYLLFPKYLKPSIERWLFGDEKSQEEDDDTESPTNPQ